MMKWIACQIICLNLAYVLIIQHMFLKVWPKSWLSVALFRFWANTFTLFETQIPSAEKNATSLISHHGWTQFQSVILNITCVSSFFSVRFITSLVYLLRLIQDW